MENVLDYWAHSHTPLATLIVPVQHTEAVIHPSLSLSSFHSHLRTFTPSIEISWTRLHHVCSESHAVDVCVYSFDSYC